MPYKDKAKQRECNRKSAIRYRSTVEGRKTTNAYARKWRAENKEHCRQYKKWNQLKNLYGISPEEYNLLFHKQEGKCAICGKHQTELKKALGIDHCHRTKQIRGLLCGKCNQAIGLLGEDIENLKCAVLYLNKRALVGQPAKPQPEQDSG